MPRELTADQIYTIVTTPETFRQLFESQATGNFTLQVYRPMFMNGKPYEEIIRKIHANETLSFDEVIAYALTTDDIKTIPLQDLNNALYAEQVGTSPKLSNELFFSLSITAAATEYAQKQRRNETFLKNYRNALHDKLILRTVPLVTPGTPPLYVNLAGANLSHCDLSSIHFADINVAGANFTGADLSGASFVRCNIKDANFKNANLSGITMLDTKDLTEERHAENLRNMLDDLRENIRGNAREHVFRQSAAKNLARFEGLLLAASTSSSTRSSMSASASVNENVTSSIDLQLQSICQAYQHPIFAVRSAAKQKLNGMYAALFTRPETAKPFFESDSQKKLSKAEKEITRYNRR